MDSFESEYSDLGIDANIPPSHRILFRSGNMEYRSSNTATGIVQDSHLTSSQISQSNLTLSKVRYKEQSILLYLFIFQTYAEPD